MKVRSQKPMDYHVYDLTMTLERETACTSIPVHNM